MNLIDRADAQRLGMKRYFTGRPCNHGHIAERSTTTRHCVICAAYHRRGRWASNPEGERVKEKVRRERRERDNPEHEREKRKRYYKVEDRRKFNAKYGGYMPPPPEKDCPPRPKDGKCQCCGKPRRLVLEHDHHTGKFRGWTCNPCNIGLSAFGDSMAGIRRAVQYMAKFYLTGRA